MYAIRSYYVADSFDKNSKTSLLPHKTIAVYAGLGWIGKSNLLVTREYGSALSMCTVLTNMPCPDESGAWLESECSSCTICSEICAPKVLHDTAWTAATSRDQIVNVYECRECLV